MELNRISSHLVCLATGGMELGALTAMTFGFRERELVLDLFELITGLRMNHAYVRPGGLAQDLPATDDKGEDMQDPDPVDASTCCATGSRTPRTCWWTTPSGWAAPRASATWTSTGCMALGMTGPMLRSTGLPLGRAQGDAVLRLRALRLRGARPQTPATPTAGS